MDSKSMGASETDRSEKLAAARKKLQQYQKKREKHKSGQSGHISRNESRDELTGRTSSVSCPHPIIRSNSSFIHNEEKSAFQRVNSRSNSVHMQKPHDEESDSVFGKSAPATFDTNGYAYETSATNNLTTSVNRTISPNRDSFADSDTTPIHASSFDSKQLVERCQQLEGLLTQQNFAYQHVSSQMETLQTHYAQLHAAYTALVDSQQNGANAENADLAVMVRQHAQTISVLVEEKSSLESQLRQVHELASVKHAENEELEGRLQASRKRLEELEKSIETVKANNAQMEHTLRNQRVELEKRREEAARFETHAINMQQDKSELQARLKVQAREAEKMSAEVGDLRKTVQMKEIYIRQLSAHAAGVSRIDELESLIKGKEAEVANIKTERDRLKNDLESVKAKSVADTLQLQTELEQVRSRELQLSQELQHERQTKVSLESRFYVAQERVDMLQQELSQHNATHMNESRIDAPDVESTISTKENEKIADEVKENQFEMALYGAQEKVAKLNDEVLALNSKLTSANQDIKSRDERIALMLDSLNERQKFSATDSNSTQHLLKQIHNERATVSRALAQNYQLKEQLVELEDKLVALTNQNMELATQRETLEHQLQQSNNVNLQQELANLQDELKETKLDLQSTKSQLASIERENGVREEDESKCEIELELQKVRNSLSVVQTELSTARAQLNRTTAENDELHRIMQQNSQDENQNSIHFELQQAIDRATQLAQENAALQRIIDENEQSQSCEDEPSRAEQTGEKHRQGDVTIEAAKLSDVHYTLEQLQIRFIRAMNENAEMNAQKDQLEHLIEQLQNETDTIGEYITIYLHQRDQMNAKMLEKEETIAKLTRQHFQNQNKLEKLQRLVMQALQDKHNLHPYVVTEISRGKLKTRKYDQNTVEMRIGENGQLERPDHSPINDTIASRIRSLSISEVNEIEPAEHVLVECGQSVSDIDESHSDDLIKNQLDLHNGHASPARSANSEVALLSSNNEIALNCEHNHSPTAQILQLLNDLRTSRPLNTAIGGELVHCKECTGKLITV